MAKNMTTEQKEALMKAKQEQRELMEKISKQFPKFATSNLMGVKKRLLALQAIGVDMYRLRCFGKLRIVKSKFKGRDRQVKIKTMNAPAFNKFANILLANKEVFTWFNQVAHDPTWEAFWVTIEKLARKPKTLDTWSAAEWMVARNRFKDTVELVNQLSVKFLGKEMAEVKTTEVEVTALFNKETYYFRYVSPQMAWDECKDINLRYFPPPNDAGRFCVGDGYYQHQMKSGKYHGYIVDKTVDAKTNSYKGGEKFSFGFVLVTSGGVADWGFGPENQVTGGEEELAKAIFGASRSGGLTGGQPEEQWIRMIMADWFNMRQPTYNQWCSHIEKIVDLRGWDPTGKPDNGFYERTDKNGKIFLEYFYNGNITERLFLNPRGVRQTAYASTWTAGADGFCQKLNETSSTVMRWYMQAPDTANMQILAEYQQNKLHRLRDSSIPDSPYHSAYCAKTAGGTLWELASKHNLPWELYSFDMDSSWENAEFTRPHLFGLSRSDFEVALLEEKKQEAVFSLRTKDAMTLQEMKRQIRKFNEMDNFFEPQILKMRYERNELQSCNKSGVNGKDTGDKHYRLLLQRLINLHGYKWMKTASGYMLVSPILAYNNADRIMTDAQSRAIDMGLEKTSGLRYKDRLYFSYGILTPMADEILLYDAREGLTTPYRARMEQW
jgi:hypothetical protein